MIYVLSIVSLILGIKTVNFLYQLFMKIFGISRMGVDIQMKIIFYFVATILYSGIFFAIFGIAV